MIPFLPDFLTGIVVGFLGAMAVALLWPRAFGLIRAKTDPAIQAIHDEVKEGLAKVEKKLK